MKQTSIKKGTELYNFLSDSFIKPLESIGFTLTDGSCISNEDFGAHVLIFTSDSMTKETLKRIPEICIQQDDSQPASTYSYYYGDLYLFIPFNA